MTDATLTAPSPYAAPASNLQKLPETGMPLTVEQALSRGYDFSIFALLGEAWGRIKGTKRVILGSYLLLVVALLGLAAVTMLILTALGVASVLAFETTGVTGLAVTILTGCFAIAVLAALIYPYMVGVALVGIRRAADQPIKFVEVFSYFDRTLPLVGAAIMMWFFINICGLILGVAGPFLPMPFSFLLPLLGLIPLIYFSVAYTLTLPLIAERGLTAWQAMEASRKSISQHWFRVLGLYLMFVIISILFTLPFFLGLYMQQPVIMGIGILIMLLSLIWTLPWMVVANGILYRTIFGVLPQTR